MRLTGEEVAAIKASAREAFGASAVVRLFGSRIHDHLRGGDIDLHIEGRSACGRVGRAWPVRGCAVPSDRAAQGGCHHQPARRHAARLRAHRLSRWRDIMTPEQEVIADLLATARRLAASARETLTLIETIPFDEAGFQALTPIERIATTAALKQFEQIEDTLNGLFRAILRALGIRLKGLYPLDIGHRMEELDVLDDAERWLAIVKLRNELVHDYPKEEAEQLSHLQAAIAALPVLFDAVYRTGRLVAARDLLADNLS